MQGTTLQLGKTWKIGEPLGGGGFGQVYAATCDGERAAAKFVPKLPGAQRELLFVDLGSARNVVPVIDVLRGDSPTDPLSACRFDIETQLRFSATLPARCGRHSDRHDKCDVMS